MPGCAGFRAPLHTPADSAATAMTVLRLGPKRLFVGQPMRSSQLSDTLLPKWLAMPVFCSDPLSSVAYATEEILLILSLGGLAFLHLAWYVAAVIVVLLVVVIASYRQTCRAYPNGGGAYTVASANLGVRRTCRGQRPAGRLRAHRRRVGGRRRRCDHLSLPEPVPARRRPVG